MRERKEEEEEEAGVKQVYKEQVEKKQMNGRKGSASLTLPTAENSLFIAFKEVGRPLCTPDQLVECR